MSDEQSALKRMMATVPQVGEVVWIGLSPGRREPETLGLGGFNAMRGLGGITASVIEPGTLRVGDAVAVAE